MGHFAIELAIVGGAGGALYALLAVGLIVEFRSSGVLNLGQGAIATIAAFSYMNAVTAWHWSPALSFAFGTVVAIGISVAFDVIVLRRMRSASAVTKVVATVGLALMLTALTGPLFGNGYIFSVPLFNAGTVKLPFGYFIPENLLAFTLATVFLCALGWALFRFTRFGRASRATVDNERAVQSLGYSARRLETLNWAIGGALAGIAGVLLSILSPPSGSSYTLILIAAVSIAILGGFQSFGIALLGGIAFGAAQALLQLYSDDFQSWTSLIGWEQAVPLVVIIAVVIFRGKTIASKEQRLEYRVSNAPLSRYPVRGAAACVLVGAIWVMTSPSNLVLPTTITLVFVVLAMSIMVLTGFAGQVSLVQMSLAGFGAFVAARVAMDWGFPFLAAVLFAGLATIPVALLIGSPSIRVRGMTLAVLTLTVAIVVDAMFFSDRNLTGADEGLSVPRPRLFGLDISTIDYPRRYALAVLAIAAIVGVGVAFLRRSRRGQSMLAVRSNERGAAAIGISPSKVKLIAFMISGFIAGVGGALYAYTSTQVSWTPYDYFASLVLVAFAYMGGVTVFSGAIVTGLLIPGGIIATLLPSQGNAGSIITIIGGAGVILIVMLHPAGIGGDVARLLRYLGDRLWARKTPEDPAPKGNPATALAAAAVRSELSGAQLSARRST
jgi:ABC-type branched-subunit amino acid transport system permease subunit